jgi:hypothetical protein
LLVQSRFCPWQIAQMGERRKKIGWMLLLTFFLKY